MRLHTLIGSSLGLLLLSACTAQHPTIQLPEPTPIVPTPIAGEGSIVGTESSTLPLSTPVYFNGTTTLTIHMPTATSTATLIELSDEDALTAVKAYQAYLGKGYSFALLPKEVATIGTLTPKGSEESTLDITFHGIEQLPYNDYLLPISIDVDGTVLHHFMAVSAQPGFSPLSPSKPKPMPNNYFGGPEQTKPIKMVAYVETNDWDVRNMANFVLEGTRQPVFDMVVLFAANMNWNAIENRRYISFNTELQPIVNNPDLYLRPLQERGIKVIVDILPNHQGVGYSNFQSYEEALDFARDAKAWTDKVGFDGWDIDEEYADYHNLPQLSHKHESWLWYTRAMKEVMPDKLLTLYDYAHDFSSRDVDDQGKGAWDYIDYSWVDYGLTHPSRAGLPNECHGTNSVQASYGQNTYKRMQQRAQWNLANGYGILMVFNITGTQIQSGAAAEGLSGATEIFYGQRTVFDGKYYVGPKGR